METSYIDYAMSTIVARAIPDVRDGLKPVHRRLLYSMDEISATPTAAYRKSARVVGDTMGKYHPHGDQALYDALVRMAQPFSIRYPLVDGQGNFGSVDGDPAAAMRYTETRLTRLAAAMLDDLDRDTVDFVDNFDGTAEMPEVLPSVVPNLLINGSTGIAVGMATSIPPHNLREVGRAIEHYIENPEATSRDLMRFVRGPDFPTGGIIVGAEGIEQAYTQGRGRVSVRAVVNVEEVRGTTMALVVSEIPYLVNKARLVEKIASLVRDKVVAGVRDIRDESDRHGMRVVVELRGDARPAAVAESALQAHGAAVDLQHQQPGAGGRAAGTAAVAPIRRTLRAAPADGGAAPNQVRSEKGPGARAPAGRLCHRAGRHRQGDQRLIRASRTTRKWPATQFDAGSLGCPRFRPTRSLDMQLRRPGAAGARADSGRTGRGARDRSGTCRRHAGRRDPHPGDHSADETREIVKRFGNERLDGDSARGLRRLQRGRPGGRPGLPDHHVVARLREAGAG